MDVDRDYALLLIDLKESTKLAPEVASPLLAGLEEELGHLSADLDPGPVLGLTLSYGDEVAGLFSEPNRLYDVVDHVRDWLWPDLAIRFVAVRGTVGRASDDIRQLGGEVFKRANDAILQLKKRRRFCAWLLGDPALDAALDSLGEMSNSLLEEMTEYQRTVYRLVAVGLAQKEIAARLGKLPQSVSDAIKRGRAELVLEAKSAMLGLLATASSMDFHGFAENSRK